MTVAGELHGAGKRQVPKDSDIRWPKQCQMSPWPGKCFPMIGLFDDGVFAGEGRPRLQEGIPGIPGATRGHSWGCGNGHGSCKVRQVLLKKEIGVRGVANREDPTFPTLPLAWG